MNQKIPLLFIPGLAANHIMWRRQIEILSDIADCRVAPLPALDDLGAIAEHILDRAPEWFAMAGWSMGGYLCFELLRRAPERVLRLALLSTAPDPEMPKSSERRLASIRDSERRGFLAMARDTVPRFVHPDRRDSEKVIETMVTQALQVGEHAYCQHQRAMMKPRDYRDLLPDIVCPTTMVVGRQDTLTRVSTHARMARAIPNATLAVIEDAGHVVTLERPGETGAALRHWLVGKDQALAA